MFDQKFKEKENKKSSLSRKAIFSILSASIVMCVAAFATVGTLVSNTILSNKNAEQFIEVGAYQELSDSDARINNCPYVEFNAFFTKDLDGDGRAEKYNGVSSNISEKQRLYFDLSVLTDGTLEDAKISIDGKNFALETAIIKDEQVKENYIGSDTTLIEFNNLTTGTFKRTVGFINKRIGNNINNYSRTDNAVTLTGTWVSSDKTTRIQINKTCNLTVDWNGKTVTEVRTYPWITTYHYIEQTLSQDYVTLSFDVGYVETADELLLQKQITEVDIPYYNGIAPEEVITTSSECTYEYRRNSSNSEYAGRLTITREAELDAGENIINGVPRENTDTVQVKYPIAAYQNSDKDFITLTFPTTGYYYGYNNKNVSLGYQNPYISSATRAWTHTWEKRPVGEIFDCDVYIGKYIYGEDVSESRYVVSKEKPLKIYNNIGLEDNEKDQYTVTWRGFFGRNFDGQNGIYLEETESDELLDKAGNYTSFKNYISTTGIYFSNLSNILKADGWLKVFDKETNRELLTVNGQDFYKYTESQPFEFEVPVKQIRIETSEAIENSYLNIYQIKEIDDVLLTDNFTKEQFDNQEYIYTYLTGGVLNNGTRSIKIDDTARAIYEEPISSANLTVDQEWITNQEINQITMKVTTDASKYNEVKWKNGVFIIEMPEDISEVIVNDVTSSKADVTVISYETFEKNGKQFIKIYTSNENETTFELMINADVIADPSKPTNEETVKLYAINNNCHNYRDNSRILDTQDVDNNGNTSEYLLYRTDNILIIAPDSLVTWQSLSNFDDNETEVMSPKIAILDKSNNSREATVNVAVRNNYNGTISETVIIGKIPFENNTFQINSGNMGSTYDTQMKETGITLPVNVAQGARVYYSTNENITVENNTYNWNLNSNNWKLAEEVTDWSKIRTYAIDLSDYVLAKNDVLEFSYNIIIPNNVNYNDISYSTHAVFFSEDTPDGKLSAKIEVSKLGIMIAKKYNLELIKYKKETNTEVKNAVYQVTEGNNTITGITREDGTTILEGLYVDREYTLREIATPNDYVLNSNEIKFKIIINNAGEPEVVMSNTDRTKIKGTPDIENKDGKYTLKLQVEDEAKYDVKITKTGNSGERLKGVKYKLTGGVYGETGRIYTTNKDGEILIINLIPGTTYTLQEIRATGYYVKQDAMTFRARRNTSGNLELVTGNSEIEGSTIREEEGIAKATIFFNLIDEKIPTYKLKLLKKSDKEEALADAQFKLTSVDTGETQYLTTNSEGMIEIDGLYQYVIGKNITGEYILQEISAPEGYIPNQTKVRFRTRLVSGKLNVSILEGSGVISNTSSTDAEVIFEIENKPVFTLIKKGDSNTLLPNAKFIITDLDGNIAVDTDGNSIGILYNNSGADPKNDWTKKVTISGNRYYYLETDENGEFTANLPKGMYKIVEVEVPEGYVLPEKEKDRTWYVGIGESRPEETKFGIKWAKSITGQGWSDIYDALPTEDSGYIVAGSYRGEMDINGEKGVDAISQNSFDGLIAKYDNDGELEWNYTLSSNETTEFKSIAESMDGYVVCGIEGKDGVIAKVNKSGEQIWKKNIGGTGIDELKGCEVLDNGDIVVSGRTNSPTITFGTATMTNQGMYDGFIVCYSSDGSTYKWYKGFQGTDRVSATDVVKTTNGIVVSVNFHGSIKINNRTITASGTQDSIIVCYATNGTYKWYKQIGGIEYNRRT